MDKGTWGRPPRPQVESIFGRLLRRVDDEDGHRHLLGYEPEAEFLLECGENGWAGSASRRSRKAPFHRHASLPFEGETEIVITRQSGLIDDGSDIEIAEAAGEASHRSVSGDGDEQLGRRRGNGNNRRRHIASGWS